MKRVLNFQKLIFTSWFITTSPQERANRGFKNDIASYILMVLPFIFMGWVDSDIIPMMWSALFPLIVLIQVLFKDMTVFNTIPVTRRFVAGNLILIAPVVTCAFGVLMLLFLVPTAIVNIGHGVAVFDTPTQKILITAFAGFCLYVLCLVILMLPSKAKIAASVLYMAVVTIGIYLLHSAIPASYGRYNGDNALILSYVLKNFGFWSSLAAAAALAVLFVAAGFAILPRLMLKRGIEQR